MQLSANVSGFEELDKKLSKLEGAMPQKVLSSAMMFALKPTVDSAKSITPVGHYSRSRLNAKNKSQRRSPGTLKKAISRKRIKPKGRASYTAKVRIRFDSKKAFYWRFVVGGTNPHDLNSGSKRKRNYIGYKRGKSKLKRRMHPGTKGKDILQIAYRLNRRNIELRFVEKIGRVLQKAAKG
jgi:hypothetical protein